MYRYVKKTSIVIFVLLFFAILWMTCILYLPSTSRGKQHKIFSIAKLNGGNSFRSLQKSIKSVNDLLNSSDLDNVDTKKGKDYLSRIKTDCKDTICSQFLTSKDQQYFNSCVKKTWELSVNMYTEPAQSTCVFVNGSGKFPMALASYPSSGSNLVRGLIQTTTGLCTGAVYCDTALRSSGYPGEYIQTATTFIVTTHQLFPSWSLGEEYNIHNSPNDSSGPAFSGAVFVMRNPFDAIVAEFKKHTWDMSNVGDTTPWNSFVKKEALVWQQTVLGWLVPRKVYPVLVVKYEELVLDTKAQLERIVNFLQVPYSKRQLDIVVHDAHQLYKRQLGVAGSGLGLYTEAQKKYMGNIVKVTSSLIVKYGHRPLIEYVDSHIKALIKVLDA